MKKAPFKQKNRKKLFDFKGYLKGQQGLIPDIKGKSTKQSLNESQFFNPKTTDERLSDQMDSKMRASYIKEKDTFDTFRQPIF